MNYYGQNFKHKSNKDFWPMYEVESTCICVTNIVQKYVYQPCRLIIEKSLCKVQMPKKIYLQSNTSGTNYITLRLWIQPALYFQLLSSGPQQTPGVCPEMNFQRVRNRKKWITCIDEKPFSGSLFQDGTECILDSPCMSPCRS